MPHAEALPSGVTGARLASQHCMNGVAFSQVPPIPSTTAKKEAGCSLRHWAATHASAHNIVVQPPQHMETDGDEDKEEDDIFSSPVSAPPPGMQASQELQLRPPQIQQPLMPQQPQLQLPPLQLAQLQLPRLLLPQLQPPQLPLPQLPPPQLQVRQLQLQQQLLQMPRGELQGPSPMLQLAKQLLQLQLPRLHMLLLQPNMRQLEGRNNCRPNKVWE